ncbi:hypothetical protein BJV74DRAFT_891132 [Russula compacta]|nr:hypothetical protein BJV74DRAFT_891132 [Russula compacta]
MKTVGEANALYKWMIAMGLFDIDQLCSVILINLLSDHYEHIQSNLMSTVDNPYFDSNVIMHHLQQEDNLNKCHSKQNSQSSITVLTAQNCGQPCTICTHCKHLGHLAEFCIQPGGKMVGHTVEEARNAQWAFKQAQSCNKNNDHSSTPSNAPAPPCPASARIVATDTQPATSSAQSVIFEGITYIHTADQPITSLTCITHSASALAEKPISDSELSSAATLKSSFSAFLALSGPSKASIDWRTLSQPVDASATEASLIPSHTTHVLLSKAEELPFLLDSGASAHISSE